MATGSKQSSVSAFGAPGYRWLFLGQVISMPGTFVQTSAQAWLVLDLTHSASALGWIIGLQYLPMLVFGAPAGVIVDRHDRRRLYFLTQAAMGTLALGLGVCTASGAVSLWVVGAFAVTLGIVATVDQPTKNALVFDLVGKARLPHAISVGNALANSGRVLGTPIAAVFISTLGTAACFFANAASFVAILAMLTKVRIPKDRIERAVRRTDRGFRDGLSYVRSAHDLRNILIFAAFFFMFAWQYDVTLPLLARKTFHGGPTTFAVLSSAIGLGAIVSLFARRLVRTSGDRKMLGSAAVYGVATTGAALSTNVATMAVALFMAGLSITVMITAISARLQLRTRPDMRGRVIALWTVAVLGTRPIGAPLSGALAAWSGPRWALAIGALTPLGLWLALRGRPARPIELPVDSAVSDTELIEVAEEAGFVETVSEAADPLLPLIDPVPERAGPAQT